jgi:hypothetical protein
MGNHLSCKDVNVVAIEAFIADLHQSAKRMRSGKFLDCETNRFRCGGKAVIAQRVS